MDKQKQQVLKNELKKAVEPQAAQEKAPEQPGEVPKQEQPRILSVVFDPTPAHVQKLQGEDKYRFSNSRWYGCSMYYPLAEYCSRLMESDDPVDRMTGAYHLEDRFLVDRETYPLSDNEKAIERAAHNTAQTLFENGALPPLVMVPIKFNSLKGVDVLKHHYVPSCGFNTKNIIPAFVRYMSDPEQWMQVTRERMAHLHKRIEAGVEKPVRGYQK